MSIDVEVTNHEITTNTASHRIEADMETVVVEVSQNSNQIAVETTTPVIDVNMDRVPVSPANPEIELGFNASNRIVQITATAGDTTNIKTIDNEDMAVVRTKTISAWSEF